MLQSEYVDYFGTNNNTCCAITITYNAASILEKFIDCTKNQSEIEWYFIMIDNALTQRSATSRQRRWN
jgi:glycosyltransferase involved in cell wall biosynthesis